MVVIIGTLMTTQLRKTEAKKKAIRDGQPRKFFGSGGWNRTNGLQVMRVPILRLILKAVRLLLGYGGSLTDEKQNQTP